MDPLCHMPEVQFFLFLDIYTFWCQVYGLYPFALSPSMGQLLTSELISKTELQVALQTVVGNSCN